MIPNDYPASTMMREFTKQRFKDKRAPFVAGIELTMKCNLNCAHCYGQTCREHQDLSLLDVKKIIDDLVERNTVEIFFTGGEILMREDFEDIYIYAKEKGLIVTLLSNITLLKQKHIDLFKEYPVSVVSTTMYGYTKETYEKVTGVKGSFENFINAIDMLKNNNVPFEIKFIAMRQNIEDIHKVKALGKSLDVNMVFGFDVRPTSDGNNKPISYRVSPEEAFTFDIEDEDRFKFWLNVAKNDCTRPLNERGRKYGPRIANGYLYPCEIAHHHVFITSDYIMQGCTKASFLQYDLKNGDFDEGWSFLNSSLVKRKADKPFQCLSCDKSLYCEQCTANFNLTYGTPYEIDDFYCKVAKYRKNYFSEYLSKELSSSSHFADA